MPCSIGANHCRLRHIGWERCGHGLTSNPRECASEPFLDELLQLFHYPPRSARALLSGTLPLRYCAARFAGRAPTWRLPLSGHGGSLVTAVEGEGVEDARREVHWVSGCGPGRKRIRLNRKKTLHTLWVLVSNLGHVCGRNCVMWGFQLILLLIIEGGVMVSVMMGVFLCRTGLGGLIPGKSAGPPLHFGARRISI